MGLGGVTVRISGMGDAQTTTDDSGGYEFRGLRAGTYSVEISGFEASEVSFSSTSGAATVGVGETKVVAFDGTYVRTAGVQGQVSVDGEGLQGVTVTLKGDGEDRTEITNAAGLYAFSMLKSGTYQVGITNPDPDDYEFATTSKTATIATGETANVPFEGTLLRTAGIAGRVSLDDGMGLDGVTVTLAGAADATAMTSNGGQYSFAGLAAGAYVVSISNPDANAYNFADDELQKTVELMDDQSAIVNFSGTHTRTASISGVLFIDEVMDDKMRNDGEPTITEALAPWLASLADDDPAKMAVGGLLASATVTLRGPDLNTTTDIAIMSDGSFTTGEALMAGTYQVELPANDDDVAAALDMAGVAFVGESMVVEVAAGGMETADFPFRILKQTLTTGARMGAGDKLGDAVSGVELALFARADMTGDPLDEQTTDEMGMVTFNFDRDANTGPAGNDDIVFVKVMDPLPGDLMVSGNEFVEIVYDRTDRLSVADVEKEAATLVNVAIAFDFWIKSDEMARSGDMGLGGWKIEYCMPMAKTDDAAAVVCTGDDAAFKPLMVGEGAAAMAAVTDTATATRGKGTFAMTADPAMLPAMIYVRAAKVQPGAGGEMWTQGDALMYEHTGLKLPANNTAAMNDLGPLRVKFTTQKLTVGVYRETDDQPGFTNYQSKVDGGDQRPTAAVAKELQVELMVENSRGRLVRYDYKAFDSKGERTVEVDNPMSFGGTGLASFKHLPADQEFTVRFHAGSNRKAVVDTDSDRNGRDVDTYGGDLADGSSVGAFGAMGGAGPEVKLCPMSSSSDNDMCSTFAYQWATGSLDGMVLRRKAGVPEATVNIDAKTANHSPNESTKTSKAKETVGNYAFSGIQDGDYYVYTPATDDHKADTVTFSFYHDEDNDDDANDGILGKPMLRSHTFELTALRLEIRGFVANDGQEGDNTNPDLDKIVRGDEAVAGIELELLTIVKVSANKKDTTFKVHDKVMTDDDGSYVFEDVIEGDAYFVRATGSGIYVAAEASAKDGFSRKVAANEYPAVEEGEFALPYWDYNAGTTQNTKVTVNNADGTVKADFVNFALLYADGTISGRVREASGSPGNITIELIRCETYDADDRECSRYNRTDFPTMTTETKANGTWEFNDLLEGWYEVFVGEAGYLPANIDENNVIDDDAEIESAEKHTDLVKGKRDLAAGNNFYVYDNGLSDDVSIDGATIKGTVDPDEDPVELPANDESYAITWASKTVTVALDIDDDASFAVRTESRGTRPWPQSDGVATVELDYNPTGSENEGEPKATTMLVKVTAENGYHDFDGTATRYRAAPLGNTIVAGDFTVEAPTGASIRADQGVVDQFSMNVAEDATALTFTVTLEDSNKQELVVMMGGNAVEPSGRKGADRAHEFRYELTLASGANTVDLTVTSEDDVDRDYQLVVRRGDAPGVVATLTDLSVSNLKVPISFAPNTLRYNVAVEHHVTTVDVGATAASGQTATVRTSTAGASASGNTVTLAPAGETTVIEVAVSGTGFVTRTYYVDVARDAVPPTTATLTDLSVSGLKQDISFSANTKSYDVAVEHDVPTVDVDATAASGLDVTVGLGEETEGGSVNENTVTLAGAGMTTVIEVTVSGTGFTTATYTVNVARDAVPATPTVSLHLSSSSINEGGTGGSNMATVTASLSARHSADVVVTVAAAAGDDSEATDFTLSATTLTIRMGQTSSTETNVTITANQDVDANSETVTVSGTVDAAATAAGIEMHATNGTRTLTIVDDEEAASAPQRLEVKSPGTGALTVTWRAPADEGTEGIDGYQYRVAPNQTWTQAGTDGAARSVAITTGLSDGRAATIYVRAFADVDDGAGGTILVPGDAASVTGTPWPGVTIGTPSPVATITEADDPAVAGNQHETTVAITLDGISVTSVDVDLELYAGAAVATPEAETDKAEIVGGSRLTFAPGVVSMNVTIRAVDNDIDDYTEQTDGTRDYTANSAFRVVAELADDHAEAADRLEVVSTDPVTITDDDFRPGIVTDVAATAGDTKLTVTWTDLPDLAEDGSNNTTSKGNGANFKYQYRYGITTTGGVDISFSAWRDATHSADGTEITGLLNGVGYTVEVRGVNDAGDGTAGTATGTPAS